MLCDSNFMTFRKKQSVTLLLFISKMRLVFWSWEGTGTDLFHHLLCSLLHEGRVSLVLGCFGQAGSMR